MRFNHLLLGLSYCLSLGVCAEYHGSIVIHGYYPFINEYIQCMFLSRPRDAHHQWDFHSYWKPSPDTPPHISSPSQALPPLQRSSPPLSSSDVYFISHLSEIQTTSLGLSLLLTSFGPVDWNVVTLYFKAEVHLQVNRGNVCLSGSELPHSGWYFLLL